jgi:hypothetical protein
LLLSLHWPFVSHFEVVGEIGTKMSRDHHSQVGLCHNCSRPNL